ncbi:MAG: hypothetical protein O8C63_13975 [Candidatus Methanoperedens sp.]|nr:hypothetical protein [Candidatus Methanoperedens sp.]
MIRLLVFEVLLFGLFGVLLGQFIGQSREAYSIWIQEIVYPSNEGNSTEKKRMVCSAMESLSREICGLSDFITIISGIIVLTFIVIFFTVVFTIDSITSPVDHLITIASTSLAAVIVATLPYILFKLNINLINTEKTSQIDDKIFEVWRANKCLSHRHRDYSNKLQPSQLFETLNEKVNSGEIVPSEDEIRILELYNQNKKNVNHQS